VTEQRLRSKEHSCLSWICRSPDSFPDQSHVQGIEQG
jgi:hypothetical protein